MDLTGIWKRIDNIEELTIRLIQGEEYEIISKNLQNHNISRCITEIYSQKSSNDRSYFHIPLSDCGPANIECTPTTLFFNGSIYKRN